MKKILEKTTQSIIIGLVFLLPVFFLPITSEFYIINKNTLLIAIVSVLSLLWGFKMVLTQTLSFKKTQFDLPVVLFTFVLALSAFLSSPNRFLAFTTGGSVSTVIALALLFFIITNNLEKKNIKKVLLSFIASSTLLGLIAIYQFAGLGETFSNIAWLQNALFTPTGGPLVLISLLLASVSVSIAMFLKKISSNEGLIGTIILGGSSAICLLGLVFTIYQLFPGKEINLLFLPYKESWIIAMESIKRNPLLGVGQNNFLSAFNRFRSAGFNTLSFWDIRFENSSIYPLAILTTGGLLSLVAYILLIFKTVKQIKFSLSTSPKDETKISLIVGLLVTIIVPLFIGATFLTISFWFIFTALFASLLNQNEAVTVKSKTFSWIVFGLIAALVIPTFIAFGRVYVADINFRNSLNALSENRGADTYNYQMKAIDLSPKNDSYRRTYSQTNFALASSLSAKENLNDQEKTQVTQLIQQSIDEAKVAANLNPQDVRNWENLGQIYQNLINIAQEADQWAVAAYRQAVLTDPISPRVRLALGGLFFSLKDYDSATRQFENAVELKTDYANGYYNLAAAYNSQEKWQQAYNNLQIVASLIPADSADYQKVQEELVVLTNKLPKPEAVQQGTQESQLTTPEPIPSPSIEPIDLPEESAPEIPQPEEIPQE